ncbi:hypothetical protein J4402_03585 [Candidatus Pacearchaeota archaeon]|nr:hypothetical protein [Candidatus Pacearchaeota archaeon]
MSSSCTAITSSPETNSTVINPGSAIKSNSLTSTYKVSPKSPRKSSPNPLSLIK